MINLGQSVKHAKQQANLANKDVFFTHGDVIGRLIHQNEHEYYVQFTNVVEQKIWVVAYAKEETRKKLFQENERQRDQFNRYGDGCVVGRLDKFTANKLMREGAFRDTDYVRKFINQNKQFKTVPGKV